MSSNAATHEADTSLEVNAPSQQQQQQLSSSLKASSMNGSTATPRLLFTWDPYGTIAPTSTKSPMLSKPPDTDNAGSTSPYPSGGEECSTPSSAQHNSDVETGLVEGNTTTTTTAAAAAAAAGSSTTARPPLTINSVLNEMSTSTGARSPQLSANAAVLTPHHQPLKSQASGDAVSTHSTPSGPVLKKISTSAKDGRQYFLDFSPTTAANAAPGVGGAMPNLMLPPNLSPQSRGVSPPTSALPSSPPQPHTQQSQQVRRASIEVDALEAEGRRASTTTSPQAVPLMSPPRSSSIGGSGVLGVGPYASTSLTNHASAYATYGTSPQQRAQSSSLLGNSLNSGLLAASVGSAVNAGSAVTQHNPYRTSPTFYPVPVSATGVPQRTQPPHGAVAVQRVEAADADAELYEALESSPSTFVKRLLPPPPPLPEVARVLPMRGVVQALCERWCSLVDAVLRSREFSDVTTQPPPPPPIPSPTEAAPSSTLAATPVDGAETPTAAASSAIAEELKAWYEAAAQWYEQLDQAGAASVDIRVSSRAVTTAIDVVASGRGRRSASGNATSNSSTNPNARYHNVAGGRGAGMGGGGGGAPTGYRGGAYGYQGGNPYGGRGMNSFRGGRGVAAAPFYPASVAGMSANINAAATNEVEAMANFSGNSRNTYYGSNFNPYAESWTFSGDTQMMPPPPPPPPMAKGSYLSKTPPAGPQGYAANSAMRPM